MFSDYTPTRREKLKSKSSGMSDSLKGLEDRLGEQLSNVIQPLLKIDKEDEKKVVENIAPDDVLPAVEQLLADVQSLKDEMTDTENVQESIKNEEINKVEEFKAEMKDVLKKLNDRVDGLKTELQSVAANLGSLFTFVHGKERGKPVRLKGGWVSSTGKLIIQVGKPRSGGSSTEPTP